MDGGRGGAKRGKTLRSPCTRAGSRVGDYMTEEKRQGAERQEKQINTNGGEQRTK